MIKAMKPAQPAPVSAGRTTVQTPVGRMNARKAAAQEQARDATSAEDYSGMLSQALSGEPNYDI